MPLAIDPFFQYIKNNRLIREVIAKPNEAFTAEKIVDLALRQDIGFDPMNTARERVPLTKQEMDSLTNIYDFVETKEGRSNKYTLIGPNMYYNQTEKRKMTLEDFLPKSKKSHFTVRMPVKRAAEFENIKHCLGLLFFELA